MEFYLGTFVDIGMDEEANKTAADFIKKKIREIVKDSAKAERLIPDEPHARRPVSDLGYFEQFNRPNVDIVRTLDNPLAAFTERGLKLADSTSYDVDVIICATGFHAFDGAYQRIAIRGRDNISLSEHWKVDSTTNLGVAVSNFPNLFMILGPKSPVANVPPMIEAHVEFITGIIKHTETAQLRSTSNDKITIETTKEAEEGWVALCEHVNGLLLARKTASYFLGRSINGKQRVLVFQGGLKIFVQKLEESASNGYSGFRFVNQPKLPLVSNL